MSLRIVAVGKKHESWVVEGIERYQKRLKALFLVEWVLMAHSPYDGDRARQEESERILSGISAHAFVVVLDERGKTLDSLQFAKTLEEQLDRSVDIVVIIGGAYGVDDRLRNRAQLVWSLSPLVFPHQLVRLILIEQLYRAQQITIGGQYHHK